MPNYALKNEYILEYYKLEFIYLLLFDFIINIIKKHRTNRINNKICL